MLVRYTAHALARMTERRVSRAEVETVLAAPLRTLAVREGREEMQGRIEREGSAALLRVIIERGEVVSVITVIATRKLAKYGVQP